ncbi:sugar transferase [Streptomyces ficellus]|uniref:Sugar transferase n=1 Tax=Streptomyces ficellus TaxID=1977088 RepID=A0ABT7ZA58_9ACTN|nr:sugar transferase [Streptomyces ficellus]MDN3296142.1 sugar transferase [Streptomyces ficellus]
MTTESTAANTPTADRVHATEATEATLATEGVAAAPHLAPPRGPADRVALPPRRPAPVAPFTSSLVAADCVAVLLGALVLTDEQRGAGLLMQLTACLAALNAYAGLYRPGAIASVLDELPALAGRAALAWCAAAALLAAQSPPRAIGPAALVTAYGVHLAFVCACRAVLHHRRRAAARAHPRSALVVGPVPEAHRLAGTLAGHPEYGIRPVGVVSGHRVPGESSLPVLTTTEEIHRAVIQNGVRDAVFLGSEQAELVTLFSHYGCASWLVGGGDGGRTPMSQHLWGHEWRRLDPAPAHRGRLSKRVLDVAVAGLMLAALCPLLVLCAAAIRLSDGPGVIFRQQRVGQDGRLFTLLKFRTLRPADDEEAATRWSVAHDERMSAVGTFLRRTSLDELPQLWNVLRGDMSLVGPRPERPYFVAKFSRLHPGYAARHRMPVGLTGLAQVHGLRGDTSIEDRCRFDNHYIDHWSLWQDVCILLRTAASLIRPAGS